MKDAVTAFFPFEASPVKEMEKLTVTLELYDSNVLSSSTGLAARQVRNVPNLELLLGCIINHTFGSMTQHKNLK